LASIVETSLPETETLKNSVYLASLATSYLSANQNRFEKWDDTALTYMLHKNEISPEHDTGFIWNENIDAAAANVFSNISDVCQLEFKQVDQDADIDFWLYHKEDNILGYSFGVDGAGIFLNAAKFMNADIPINGVDYLTIAHEVIHNLGTTHPFDGYAKLPGVERSTDLGDFNFNQNIYTITSYNETGTDSHSSIKIGPDVVTANTSFGLSSLGVIDQAFLQALYGANNTTNADDTYYELGNKGTKKAWETIWDAGGNDTIGVSEDHIGSVVIDLRPASLIEAHAGQALGGICTTIEEGAYGGFILGKDVHIENASSGNGDDSLFGNRFSNLISTTGGNNDLFPFSGKDLVLGGDGDDIIHLESSLKWSADFHARQVGSTPQNSSFNTVNLDNYNRFEDHIFTGAGADKIYLTSGNDAFFLDDKYSGSHFMTSDYAQNNLQSHSTIVRFDQCEFIFGQEGDDILDISSSQLTASHTTLNGGQGDDILWGGVNDDHIIGAEGDDQINGGEGNDVLSAGTGTNILSFVGDFGNDIIEDWQMGDNQLLFYNLRPDQLIYSQNSILVSEHSSITFSNLTLEDLQLLSIDFL
jgi:serralysin